MEKQNKKHSWWQTVPGVITSIGGIISAITALLVLLHQSGVLQSSPSMADALKRYPYEFGWSGDTMGSADQSIEYYKVESIEFPDRNIAVLRYSRPGGGEVRATLSGTKLIGTWQDSDGKGELELIFDEGFARGVGWWNRGGQTQKYNAFMRREVQDR